MSKIDAPVDLPDCCLFFSLRGLIFFKPSLYAIDHVSRAEKATRWPMRAASVRLGSAVAAEGEKREKISVSLTSGAYGPCQMPRPRASAMGNWLPGVTHVRGLTVTLSTPHTDLAPARRRAATPWTRAWTSPPFACSSTIWCSMHCRPCTGSGPLDRCP